MKKISTLVGAAVVGVLMSASASAQLVPGGDPYTTAADGGMLLAVFDGTRSVTQYLGSTFSQNGISALTTEGPEAITREFSVDLTGFDLVNTQYIVVAADSLKPSELRVTVSAPVTSPTQLGVVIDSYANQVNSMIGYLFDEESPCAGLTICVATSALDSTYWGISPQGSFPFRLAGFYQNYDGTSQPLEFWDLKKVVSLGTGSSATRYQSADGTRIGTWHLTGTGADAKLTYLYPAATLTEVPLPAAAWLMVSGLLGLGAVGRRRQAAAA